MSPHRQRRRRLRPLRSPAVAVALVFVLGACSDDGSDGGSADGTATTVVSPTTAIDGGDSTTPADSTTTAPVTTATPTTAAPTTTAPDDDPDTDVDGNDSGSGARPTGLVLLGDGIGPLAFGTSPDAAVDFLSAALGPPQSDSGWGDSFSVFGTCPGSEVRGVEWPGLLVLFGDADDGYGTGRHFMSWAVSGDTNILGLVTEQGVGIGATRDDVAAAYSGADFFDADGPFPAGAAFETARGSFHASFEDDVQLSYLTAGTACGE